MASPLEVKLRNAESSILFMQQEHAKTLQALHQELHKLQKKCAELTFELAMKSDDNDDEEETNQTEIKDLKDKLDHKEKECHHLQEERDQIQRSYSDFEQEMKMRERVYKEEVAQQGQKLMLLTGELDQRSETIAFLTTQMHQMKIRQAQHSRATEQERTESERVSSPAPPKDPAPARMRRFNIRTGNGPMRVVHAGKGPPEPSQVQSRMFNRFRHVTAQPPHSANHGLRTGIEGVPDVTTFIAHVDPTAKEVEVKPAPPILPPITSQEAIRREFVSSASFSADIETLAIEKPYRVKSTLKSPNHSPVHTD